MQGIGPDIEKHLDVRTWEHQRRAYMDQALTAVAEDDEDTLDLLTKTAGAVASVAHARKVAGSSRPVSAAAE